MENSSFLKVLLVDDEPFIARGLSVLVDWNALGFTIAGTASNGKQALSFLKKHPVDLILADIQMPVMDGLELIEILRRDKISDAYFVILSGYSDFEYARQALRFDCMDYLLKPVMTDQLTELLQKVRASCDRSSEGRKREKVYSSAYLAQNLLAMLQEQYDDKTVSFVESQLRLTGGIRYISIARQVDRTAPEPVKEGKAFQRELAAVCRGLLGGWANHLLDVSPGAGEGVGLIFCRGMAQEKNEYSFLCDLQQQIRAALQSPVTLFAGVQVPHITGLGKSYQTALQMRVMHPYVSDPAPVQLYRGGDADFVGIPAMALDTLVTAIEKNDRPGIRDAVLAVFGTIGTDMDLELLRVHMDYLFYRMVRLACDRDKTVNQKKLLQHLQKNMLRCRDFDRLIQFTQEYAEYIFSLRNDGGSVIQQVEQEIRLHYRENLTLKGLSQKYYVNSAYLGQLFKKKYGVTFRKYLNSCRIEQAAKLLLNTSDKVYNIAQAVGYQDMDYFIERFIDMKGCTPSNYRKINQPQESDGEPPKGASSISTK